MKQKHIITLVAITNILFFVIVLFAFPACYKQNDDVFMSWIASGVGMPNGLPNHHLIFINYLLGSIISLLYTYFPSLEWYSIFLVMIHFISFNVIILYFALNKKMNVSRIIFLCVLYAFEFRILFWLQFTTTTALCAVAGLLLIIRHNKYYVVTGFILFVIASMIRFEAAMLVGAVSAPFILLFYKRLNIKRSAFLVLTSLVIISFSFNYIDKQHYIQDPNWTTFYNYNQLRGSINDNPNYNVSNLKLPSSITKNDLSFIGAFCINPEILNINVMQNIYSQIKGTTFFNKVKNINIILKGEILMFFLSILTLFSLYLVFTQKQGWKFLIPLLTFWLICMFISLDGRLKMRVFFTMLLPYLSFLFLLTKDTIKRQNVYSTFLLFLFLGFSAYSYSAVKKVKKLSPSLREQVQLINSTNPNNTIVPLGASLSMELFPTFEITSTLKPKLGMIDCYVPSPITANLNSHLSFLDSDIYLFAKKSSYNAFSKIFIQEFQEHYQLITTTNILASNDHYVIFNFKKIDQE